MDLNELYDKCRQDPSLIPGYISKYRELRAQRITALGTLEFKDLGIKEEYGSVLPPSTKGVIVGLIKQKVISCDEKIHKIDEVIQKLKDIKLGVE